jgi:cytochrome c biogenesis protein CcmG/thiol:disulfide interchange protein DsbE
VRLSVFTSVVLIAAVCGVSSCQPPRSVRAAVKPETERKPAPDFTLKDSSGATVKLSEYRGKVVLLNFWATWCGPCKIEIPWFMEFEKAYKDRKFAVLGVSLDDDGWESVRPYIESHKINYRVMVGTEELSQLYGSVDSLPTTFMLDREGRVAAIHIGLVSKSKYEEDIRHLLDNPVSTALFRPN